MRQAYLSSPYYSQRLSSRTVLFTSVPRRYLDEARIRKLYGDSVKRIWLPRTSKHLANLVKEREQTALRLEKAEIELIRNANAVRRKQLKKAQAKGQDSTSGGWTASQTQVEKTEEGNGRTDSVPTTQTEVNDDRGDRRDSEPGRSRGSDSPGSTASTLEVVGGSERDDDARSASSDELRYTHPYGLHVDLPDVRGSVAAQYLPAEARPYHRPIANYGRRVDTIRWTRRRLLELNKSIAQIRKRLRSPHCKTSNTLSAAFVEFDTQEAAQAAHQVVAHHLPLHMAPRLLGVCPDEVVWDVLRMKWWERIIRRFAMLGLIVAAIIFWSIPSLIVGMISNVSEMADLFPFLRWVTKLPNPILGFLSGFVPPVALSMFMAMVPIFLRRTYHPTPGPILSIPGDTEMLT